MRTLDDQLARQRAAVNARFPTRAPSGVLDKLGIDRGLPRAIGEEDAAYSRRLLSWRYPLGHRTRGSAYALIAQISDYFGGIACSTIDASGNQYSRDIYGVQTAEHGVLWTWDDRPATDWGRFWIILDVSSLARAHPQYGDPLLFGGTFGHSYVGQTGLTDTVRQVVDRLMHGRAWRPAGTQPEWLILNLVHVDATFDETFDATFTESEPITPDADWARWSRLDDYGRAVPSRTDDRLRFVSLAPERNNTYGGDPTRWAAEILIPGGTFERGDPTSWPTDVDIYATPAATYAGDPTQFHASVQLPDDLSII